MLKPGGIYMVISYGKPENRLFHFEREHLSMEVQQYTIAPEEEEKKEDKGHYIYLCKKKENADLVAKENWEQVEKKLKKEEEEIE